MGYGSSYTIEGPSTMLGGLPIWLEVFYTRGDGWETDDDYDVTGVYWLKKDGTKGKHVPQHMIERAERLDDYWHVDAFDRMCDNLQPDPGDEELTRLR